MEKATMSVQELASQLGISLPKAYELVKRPGFPVLRIGTRILIPVDAFREWLSDNAFSFLKNGHEEATSRTFARMVAFSYLPESDCCSPVCSNLLNCVICSQVFYPAGVALVQFFLPDSLLAVLPLPNPALHSFFSFWIDYSLRTSGKRSADRHPQALGEGLEYFFRLPLVFDAII